MDKKSGKSGSLVAPVAAGPTVEPPPADPTEVAAIKAEKAAAAAGEFTEEKFKPNKESSESKDEAEKTDPEEKKEEEEKVEIDAIEIELIGEDDQPVAGERYRIIFPDGTADEGSLDQNGYTRFETKQKGSCKVTFPDLDQDAWKLVEAVALKVPKPETT